MRCEDPIPIVDHILVMTVTVSDHLSQLLQRPVRARVRCHVYMRQSAGSVLDDNKHVQHPERRSDRDERVTGKDRPCMVLQEAGPALIATRLPRRSLRHVLADCSRRHPNPQLDQ